MNDMILFLEGKPVLLIIVCCIAGYLMGSISFARVVYHIVTKGKEIQFYSEPVPGTDEKFDSDFVSATLVSQRLGAKYGCLTSIGDMLKIGIPTFIVKLLFTSEPYFLVVPVAGMIGHNFPLYSGFIGGRGETAMFSALLVINWYGFLLANCASVILGFLTGSIMILRWGGYMLMIFWLWFWFDDYRYGLFMFIMNFLFWFSLRNEIKRFYELRKKGMLSMTQEELSVAMMMGKGPGRAIDKYSLPVLLRNLFKK